MSNIKIIKGIFLCLAISILFSISAYAQTKEVRGKVIDDQNYPLIGATIVVKGTEGASIVGVITDLDGNFVINIPSGYDTILVTYTGYLEEFVDVANVSDVQVQLIPSFETLDEVVVTAMGIKREEKALGYSVEQVSGDNLENGSKSNPIESLAGRVAGLNVSSSASGAGGSTKVLIRGVTSITGNNSPLYVIDGVPINSGGGSSGTEYGGFDYGDGANNINPDDIENISILKGGAATALYGQRGSNGVIMITTKSGKSRDGLGIDFSSTVSFDNPLVKPDFQNFYSQGSGATFSATEYRSWGEKMTGQTVTNFLNQEQVLNGASNPYDEFYRTGVTYDNSITVNNRGERYGVYFSANFVNTDGIQPNNSFDKRNFNIRFDSELSSFIKFDAKVNYLNQVAENRPHLSGSPNNPVYLLNIMPRSVQLDQLNPYLTLDGYPVVWTEEYQANPDGSLQWRNQPPTFASSPLLQNPFWATEYNRNEDERNRILGFGEFGFDFAELFSLPIILELNARAGIDYINDYRMLYNAHNTYFKADGLATYSSSSRQFVESSFTGMLKIGHTINKFTFLGTFGGSFLSNQSKSSSLSSESGLINEFGKYVIHNFNNPLASDGLSEYMEQSVFGLFSFDYDRMVYLDLTFRNDWSSSLSPSNWSYFYPSVSASWLIHESFEMPSFINFIKVRGSYAGTGSPGANSSSRRYYQYNTNPNQYLGLPYGSIPSRRPEYDLRSEYTISKEVGLKTIMLNNRLIFDASYYQSGTKDQILIAPMPPASGFESGYINGGYINNNGVEAMISYRVLQGSRFSWEIGGNFTRQWNKVEELKEDTDLQVLGGGAGVVTVAKLGEPVGMIMGSSYARDEQGRLILDSESLPTYKVTEDGAIDFEQVIGNSFANVMWGFNSSIKYQGFTLNFVIDSKLGHDIFSLTNMRGAEYGTFAYTTEGRDEWEKAKEISEITGVPPTDGYMVHGMKDGVEGDYPVDPQKYWDRLTRIQEAFVYDASYIRFRQLSLGYTFNYNLLQKTPFDQLSITLFANNLFYISRKTENISPESSFGTGNSVGIEMFSQPELRNYGVNLKVSF